MALAPHIELYTGMPRYAGNVVDPQYVPDRNRAEYVAQWRAWAKVHPPGDWPSFLHRMKNEAASKRSSNIKPSAPPDSSGPDASSTAPSLNASETRYAPRPGTSGGFYSSDES